MKIWCPGCSQEVDGKCHLWMCPIARSEREAIAGSEREAEAANRIEDLQEQIRELQEQIRALETSLAEWKALAIQWAKDNEAARAEEQDAGIGCGKSMIEPWSAALAPEPDK